MSKRINEWYASIKKEYTDERLPRKELWHGVRLVNLLFRILKFLPRMVLMLMMHLRLLHGMHWHIVSLLETRLGNCLEMEEMIQLRCRSIRVRLIIANVSYG
jgi:hypothetical protein